MNAVDRTGSAGIPLVVPDISWGGFAGEVAV